MGKLKINRVTVIICLISAFLLSFVIVGNQTTTRLNIPATPTPYEEELQSTKFNAYPTDVVQNLVEQTSSVSAHTNLCKSDPLANVYNPTRLQVINPCIQASGNIDTIKAEADGDYHINVHLDPPFQNLLNEKNRTDEHGDLVVEVVCTNPISQQDAVSACTNAKNTVTVPPLGSHVYIVGAYVLDKHHGWMEIHPAWYIGTTPISPGTTQSNPSAFSLTSGGSGNTNTTTAGAAINNQPTALCNDGTYSYASSHKGACSHHGGVKEFYH